MNQESYYELVITDVDGVLFNTEHIFRSAYRIVGEKHGIPALNEDLFVRTTGISGADTEKLFDRVLPHIPDRRMLLEEIRQLGKEMIRKDLQLLPGAREMLDYWHQKKVPLCAATSTIRSLTEERFGRMDIMHYFSFIICGDEVCHKKPDPEIYRTVMNHMNMRPERTLVFEDTGYGVRAAYSAGADCVWIPAVTELTEEEKQMTRYMAGDMYDAITFIENIRSD